MSETTYGAWYDEVALWGDTDRFTELQLAELYEMGKNKRVPLPEYTDQWDTNGLWISGSIPAHTLHFEYLSESGNAFALGHLGVNARTAGVLPYFPAITGKPYVERMVYYFPGPGAEVQELVAGQTWQGSFVRVATLEGSGFKGGTNLTAQDASVYSVSGETNFTWHFLAKGLGSGLNSVSIGDAPSLRINSTGIYFQNAVWDGAPVQSLYSLMRGGQPHYVIANVSRIAGSDWLLNLSVDGRPYVLCGKQNSGSAPVPSLPDPEADTFYVGGSSNIYVDEVILWKNVDFTDEELALLGHAPSGAFGYQLVFLGNYEVPIPVGDTFDFTIESLLQTHDHFPQIIGKLDVVAPDTVNIEVWSCTSGSVTPLVLASTLCYPIGTTGRWGWSTETLPAEQPNKHPQYFYRMSASNGNTFEGIFFLERAKRRSPRGMPSSATEYLMPRKQGG